MKNIKRKIRLLVGIALLIVGCSTEEPEIIEKKAKEEEWRCGTHNGKELWTGPRGGCYYYNVNNNKTYVDRSECNC